MILFEQGPDGVPVLFSQPDRLIVAWEPGEVPGAFAAMAQATAAGRWLAGYGSYELGYALEPKLVGLMPGGRRVPLLAFGVYGAPPEARSGDARAMLAQQVLARADAEAGGLTEPVAAWTAPQYGAAFDRVAAYIAAGDCYQVNLTMPMTARASGTALGLYGALRRVQPVRHRPLPISASGRWCCHAHPNCSSACRPRGGSRPGR